MFDHGLFLVIFYQSYELQAESKPDVWFRGGYQELVEQVRAELASFVNAGDEDELVLVENASSGVNAVLRSLNLTSGDRVLILERAYQMVINTLDYLAEREGCSITLGIKVTFFTVTRH